MKRKYLEFRVIGEKPKTKVYGVFETRNGDLIGTIYWWGRWRHLELGLSSSNKRIHQKTYG